MVGKRAVIGHLQVAVLANIPEQQQSGDTASEDDIGEELQACLAGHQEAESAPAKPVRFSCSLCMLTDTETSGSLVDILQSVLSVGVCVCLSSVCCALLLFICRIGRSQPVAFRASGHRASIATLSGIGLSLLLFRLFQLCCMLLQQVDAMFTREEQAAHYPCIL